MAIVFNLILNSSFLLLLIFAYHIVLYAPIYQTKPWKFLYQLFVGIILGGVGVILMVRPWQADLAIILDTRTVLFSLSGLFFGFIPTFIAMSITILYRVDWFSSAFGDGVLMAAGAHAIVIAGVMGCFGRFLYRDHFARLGLSSLFIFGFIITTTVMAYLGIVPLLFDVNEVQYYQKVKKLLFPAFLIMPSITALVGYSLLQNHRRNRHERQLLQNEFLFKLQFDTANIGFSIGTINVPRIKMNARLYQMFGYTREEFQVIPWSMLTHTDDLIKEMPIYQQLISGEIDHYDMTKRMYRKDGTMLYIHVSVATVKKDIFADAFNNNNVRLHMASILDITPQKLIEEQIKESQENLALILRGGNLQAWDWVIQFKAQEGHSQGLKKLMVIAQELNCALLQYFERVRPEHNDQLMSELDHYIQKKRPTFQHYFCVTKKEERGKEYWLLVTGQVTEFSSDGQPLRLCGVYQDVTQQRHNQSEMKLAALVFNCTSEAIAVIDDRYHIIMINRAFSSMMGYRNNEVVGQPLSIFNSRLEPADFYKKLHELDQSEKNWQGEIKVCHKSGAPFIVSVHSTPILQSNRCPKKGQQPVEQIILFLRDVTRDKMTQQLIWHQANYDSLTGLPNRRLFSERLKQQISLIAHVHSQCGYSNVHSKLVDIAKEQPNIFIDSNLDVNIDSNDRPLSIAQEIVHGFALLFIDLDGFKEINDTLGYDIGDQLLRQVSRRISGCLREQDYIARLGGDEFTVILTGLVAPTSVNNVVHQIQQQMISPFSIDIYMLYISLSMGITLCPKDSSDPDKLLTYADQSMYLAKTLGRNKFIYYTSLMQENIQKHLKLTEAIRHSFELQQLSLEYQPIINLENGQIVKMEAFVRWVHPELGRVETAFFIQLAEEIGLIHTIDSWVFQSATSQLAQWRQQHDIELVVNQSIFQCTGYLNEFNKNIDHMTRLSLPYHLINIDIKENVLLSTHSDMLQKLLDYRKYGIKIALDNFGEGHTSLTYLRHFKGDYLKISPHFIERLAQDENSMILCEVIIDLAKQLGLKVIAEGVETKQQLDILINLGCDYAQGLYLKAPMSVSECSDYLQKTECAIDFSYII